jgi:hypothetical protein
MSFLAVIISLIAVFSIAANSHQLNVQSTELSLVDIGYESDDTIHGVIVSRDYVFRWPETWEPTSGNKFILKFSHSPVLDPVSTLSVELNGSRLSSVILDHTNVENAQLEVPLPGHLIKVGYNEIQLVLYQGLNDFNCRDLDDPSVWTTVHNASGWHFSYQLKRPEFSLSGFPSPFIPTSYLDYSPVTFVLPDKPTTAEVNAASSIAAILGKLTPSWHENSLNIISDSQFQSNHVLGGNLVFIGKVNHSQAILSLGSPNVIIQGDSTELIDSNHDPVPADAGVLWMQPSSTDETGVLLVVTGESDEAVMKAGSALANESSYSLFTGTFGVVVSVPFPEPIGDEVKQLITLEELGYEDRTVFGTFEQTLRYSIPQPLAWLIMNGATIDLHFAHSSLANADESFLSVMLNDIPVESIFLTEDNAEDAHAIISLPARLFEPGGNSLKIISNMTLDFDRDSEEYLNESLDCLHDDESEYKAAWLVVYSDTKIGLPGRPGSMLIDLDFFPDVFIGDLDLSELAFVLPENHNFSAVSSTILLSEFFGQFSDEVALYPHVYDVISFPSQGAIPKHQVLIGRPSDNASISMINSKLPQPFDITNDSPMPIEGLIQTISRERTNGYIQALIGTQGETILVLTGTNDDGVLLAASALRTPEIVRELAGDLAIVNSEGLVYSVDIYPDEDRETVDLTVSSEEIEPEELPRQQNWVLWLAGGLLITTLLILLVFIYLNRKSTK